MPNGGKADGNAGSPGGYPPKKALLQVIDIHINSNDRENRQLERLRKKIEEYPRRRRR
jgi:hypothetical protein